MDSDLTGPSVEIREAEALRLGRQLHGQVSSLRAKARACGVAIAQGVVRLEGEPRRPA